MPRNLGLCLSMTGLALALGAGSALADPTPAPTQEGPWSVGVGMGWTQLGAVSRPWASSAPTPEATLLVERRLVPNWYLLATGGATAWRKELGWQVGGDAWARGASFGGQVGVRRVLNPASVVAFSPLVALGAGWEAWRAPYYSVDGSWQRFRWVGIVAGFACDVRLMEGVTLRAASSVARLGWSWGSGGGYEDGASFGAQGVDETSSLFASLSIDPRLEIRLTF